MVSPVCPQKLKLICSRHVIAKMTHASARQIFWNLLFYKTIMGRCFRLTFDCAQEKKGVNKIENPTYCD